MATLKKFVPPVEFHPGITLSEKLKERGMSVKEFAVRTSKPDTTIFAVIGGKSSVTSDMAVAFESVTKIPAHFWLNIQRGYDEYVARQKREEQLATAYEWARSFPLSKMMELGWIPTVNTAEKHNTTRKTNIRRPRIYYIRKKNWRRLPQHHEKT